MNTKELVKNKNEAEELRNEKAQEINKIQESIKGLPGRFCGTLADTAFDTLHEWLVNNAPPEIAILHEAQDLLRMSEYLETDDSLVVASTKEAAWAINKLNGIFYGSMGDAPGQSESQQ